jgi:oligopeptide transport system ATP-binding protein
MTDLVLQVSGLRKEFGRPRPFVAVDDVSFTLKRGRSLAIVGESGSGKSTIAQCITGLQTPSAGSILVCGRARSRGKASLRERRTRAREIQMVFQDPYGSLDPRTTVRDTLRSALVLAGKSKGRQSDDINIHELRDLVELPRPRADSYPRQLSGGQRQRVAIARALAAEPEILVLDEAVASLDVSIQAQILNVLADIRDARGLAYLFISHDLNVVQQVTDEIVVMQKGRIVERGETLAVLSAPKHEYTRRLHDAVPRPGWVPGA